MGENLPNLVTLGGVKHEKTHFAFFWKKTIWAIFFSRLCSDAKRSLAESAAFALTQIFKNVKTRWRKL
jgi:hypothetical protein